MCKNKYVFINAINKTQIRKHELFLWNNIHKIKFSGKQEKQKQPQSFFWIVFRLFIYS